MGIFGSLIGGAVSSAIGRAIERAKNKSSSSNYSSGSSSSNSSGGVASSTTNSLRDYMGQMGQTVDYDASSGMTTIGGRQYALGSIPGTSYNPTTGQHYVTDPSALNSILGIDKQPVAEQTANIYATISAIYIRSNQRIYQSTQRGTAEKPYCRLR